MERPTFIAREKKTIVRGHKEGIGRCNRVHDMPPWWTSLKMIMMASNQGKWWLLIKIPRC